MKRAALTTRGKGYVEATPPLSPPLPVDAPAATGGSPPAANGQAGAGTPASSSQQHTTIGVLPTIPGKRPVIVEHPTVVVEQPPVVLIVEDEAALRALLVAFFESEGYAAVTASDGLEGLAALRRTPPDVMVVDMMMPRMDGPSFIAAAAAEATGIPVPVVMLSASPGLRETAMQLGVDYLAKPFDLDVLLDKVRRHTRPRLAVTTV